MYDRGDISIRLLIPYKNYVALIIVYYLNNNNNNNNNNNKSIISNIG